jgi:hypothetical protein
MFKDKNRVAVVDNHNNSQFDSASTHQPKQYYPDVSNYYSEPPEHIIDITSDPNSDILFNNLTN